MFHTDVWDGITKKHNKHTSSINSNAILSCDCKDGQAQIQTRESKSDFKRFISYVINTGDM